MIEREGTMSTNTVTVKSIAPVRVAALTGIADRNNYDDVGPVIQSLFGRLFDVLVPAGVEPAGPVVAGYSPAANEALTVTAGCPIPAGVTVDGVEITELPGMDRAASYVHRGKMINIGEAYQTLATWIEDNGYRTDGSAREVYVVSHPEPEEEWQTELLMPISETD